ncbi:MAG: hypothetical protein WD512_14720, partial [Candidatus Paceibacterota bacterium]
MNNQLPSLFQEYIHKSRYARWLWDENRREDWNETVSRYFNFFEKHLKESNNYTLTKEIRKELEEAILNLQVMPSMRCLMTAGPALEKENVAGYNCSYVAIDNPRSFDEILYTLMAGTGVGFSVEQKYVDQLPIIAEEFYKSDTTIVVADSKLGWAKSLKELIQLLYAGQIPKIDTSKVRAAGEPLKTFGGRASGPEPLVDMFNFTIRTFQNAANRRLTTLECHDIVCKIAEIVVVGGVRRSALISLSDLSDDRMRGAKSGKWWENNPQRALANNSFVVNNGAPDIGIFMKEWLSLYESKSGERGIFSRKAAREQAGKNGRRETDYDFGTNPCCLTEDTIINTKELGKITIKKSIEKIESGETLHVLGYNIENNEVIFTKIIEGKLTRPNAELIELVIEDELGISHTLKITPDHLVWTKNRGYIRADSLTNEDDLEINDHKKRSLIGKLKSIRIIKNEDTYDLQTETCNFFANDVLVHNSEIILRSRQLCNLTEVVVREIDNFETLSKKVRLATILGTFQSTLTNFRYLSKKWKENCEEERLLGVSLTGITDNVLLSGKSKNKEELQDILTKLKQVAIDTNKEYAKKLGINQSTATTAVKPSGTVSSLVDSASGIHARHSPYYIRTIRADKKDPLAKLMKDMGFPVEDDVMRPQHTDIFSFPIKSPPNAIFRKDMNAIEQLELWLVYQRFWCEHKPSITVSVKEHEWLEVGSWVYNHFNEMSGVSFLPFSDHSYRQAPYQDCTKEEYDELVKLMPKEIDWGRLIEYETT